MKRLLYVGFGLLLCIPGCKHRDEEVPSTTQQPVVEQYAGEQEYKNTLDDLISRRDTIRHNYEELAGLKSPAPDEPVLSGQQSELQRQILDRCGDLEDRARKLLDHPYLQEHKGESGDAQSLIDFAQEYRQKVQTGG